MHIVDLESAEISPYDCKMEIAAAVTCMESHPVNDPWLAIGLANGEVLIKDLLTNKMSTCKCDSTSAVTCLTWSNTINMDKDLMVGYEDGTIAQYTYDGGKSAMLKPTRSIKENVKVKNLIWSGYVITLFIMFSDDIFSCFAKTSDGKLAGVYRIATKPQLQIFPIAEIQNVENMASVPANPYRCSMCLKHVESNL